MGTMRETSLWATMLLMRKRSQKRIAAAESGAISLAPLSFETAVKATLATGKAPPPPPPKRPKRKGKK